MEHITKRRIKLAIVENSLAIGGVQRLVLDQITFLDREKFDVHLITLTQPKRADFYSLLPNDVVLTKLDFSSIRDFNSWFQLIQTLRKFSPDVVKSSMYFSNSIVRILKPFLGYSVVTAEHNTNDGKTFLQRKINRFLNRFSYTTVVDSNMVADHLSISENLPRNKFTVIHNGVDIDEVKKSEIEFVPQREILRKEYGISTDDKVFLTIGRVVRQKNHLRMVKAFSILLKSRSDCRLIIIGDGALKENVQALIKQLDMVDKVILVEATKDIHRFYVMSDITLLSSDHEGFCIAAMEGLAFGKPLVSTKVAGVIEYLEDGKNGFFADKTPEDLAMKMEKIITLPPEQFAQFQAEARKTASNYSLEKYGDKFIKLIRSCSDLKQGQTSYL